MEILPPAPMPPNVVVGATIVKRFPGYGERRGTIAEIDLDGGKVVVRWATDESTISIGEAAKRALYAVPLTEEEEDGDSTIAYDSGDDTATYVGEGGARSTSSRFYDQEAAAHAVNAAIRRAGLEGRRKTNPVVDGQLVPKRRNAPGHGRAALRKRRRDESAAAAPSPRARRR